ncbi:hypothetical protein ACFL59_07355 [Planctomycetota bacterium]
MLCARQGQVMRHSLLLLLLLVIGLVSGCAFTDLDHLATTNWLDRTMVPDDKVGQWVLTPLFPPLAAATMAVDNLVIAPAVSLPSACEDTRDWLEKDVGGYFTSMGILPFRIALTPAIFAGSWFGRSIFSVDPREDASWKWPTWGRQWVRDRRGRLLGSPDSYDPVSKEPLRVRKEKILCL